MIDRSVPAGFGPTCDDRLVAGRCCVERTPYVDLDAVNLAGEVERSFEVR